MVIQWSLIKPLLYAADNEVEEEKMAFFPNQSIVIHQLNETTD